MKRVIVFARLSGVTGRHSTLTFVYEDTGLNMEYVFKRRCSAFLGQTFLLRCCELICLID